MAFEISAGMWTAIAFLFVGLILILGEIFNPGFFIAVPGGTLAIMGIFGLIAPDFIFSPAWWFVLPVVGIVATVGNLYIYKRWAPAGTAPITLSTDSLPGLEGQVAEPVDAGSLSGKVLIRGSTWSARTEPGQPPIPIGAAVTVVRSEGVHVVVRPRV
ncbi:MAG: NfeD family protein [Candidatus Thermoplasmatota archaeon]